MQKEQQVYLMMGMEYTEPSLWLHVSQKHWKQHRFMTFWMQDSVLSLTIQPIQRSERCRAFLRTIQITLGHAVDILKMNGVTISILVCAISS